MPSVTVVGAGIIGLTCAYALVREGWAVQVCDPAPGSGPSRVAGGMIAPYGEALLGQEALHRLSVRSLARWDALLEALAEDADATGLVTSRGSLFTAHDAADLADLRRDLAVADPGTPGAFRRVSRTEIAELAPGVVARGGYACAAEFSVDNRAVLATLTAALANRGVAVRRERGAAGEARVVLATGVGHGSPVRPVKGEILRLCAEGNPIPPVTVRARVRGRSVYLVPRAGGLVVGATQYEAPDAGPRAGGVLDLLADAAEVFPAIREYTVAEVSAGMRPGTPDGLPLVGDRGDGVVVATGHGRDGFLLAPITADLVLAALRGEPADPVTDPRRFA